MATTNTTTPAVTADKYSHLLERVVLVAFGLPCSTRTQSTAFQAELSGALKDTLNKRDAKVCA